MDRNGDIILCETCALMDFVGLASTLANNGHPEYWGDVERMVRNQLAESQVIDGSWLKPGTKPDTYQFSWRDVARGWSAAMRAGPPPRISSPPEKNLQWGGPELRNKTRAFQNCCGGSGTHGFYIVWKNAARVENGMLSVNLHIDKLLPAGRDPLLPAVQGLLTIDLKRPARSAFASPISSRPTRSR